VQRFRVTYFRNAAGFPGTAPSIPLILTGRYYDNAVPFQDFVRSTTRASLPQALKAANYHVYYHNLYYWPSLYADPTIASDTLERTLRWHDAQSRRWAAGLMLLGAFRTLPQAGKQFIEGTVTRIVPRLVVDEAYNDDPLPMGPRSVAGGQAAEGDVAFFKVMASQSSTGMTTPTFKYYHLWGIHPPLLHDENLQSFDGPFTRGNAKRQAKGALRLLQICFEKFMKPHL
jgi:hypothetical protein